MLPDQGFPSPFPFASSRDSFSSIASRMNAAMRFGPATASIRFLVSSDSRTSVGFTFNAGRPIRGLFADIGKCVNTTSQLYGC